MANVLRHSRFERSPIASPKRARLPSGVVSITSVPRLRPGAVAIIVAAPSLKSDVEPRQNLGKRVRVTDISGRSGFCVLVDSLDGPLALDDGGRQVGDIRYRPANLRRAWVGLSNNERVRLSMLRQGVANG